MMLALILMLIVQLLLYQYRSFQLSKILIGVLYHYCSSIGISTDRSGGSSSGDSSGSSSSGSGSSGSSSSSSDGSSSSSCCCCCCCGGGGDGLNYPAI